MFDSTELNARDAWSKLIIEYANNNISFSMNCPNNNKGYELNTGLSNDGENNNFIQLIQNLLPGVIDLGSLLINNISSIHDKTENGLLLVA